MPAPLLLAYNRTMNKALTALMLLAGGMMMLPAYAVDDNRYDPDAALQLSQQAIGQAFGDFDLIDQYGETVTGAVDMGTAFVDDKTGGALSGVTGKVEEATAKVVKQFSKNDGDSEQSKDDASPEQDSDASTGAGI